MEYSTARGWWRILAGVLLVGGVTLGLAFYLPLAKSQRILTGELQRARATIAQLSGTVRTTEDSLQSVSAARAELEGFKNQVHAEQQKYPDLAQRLRDASVPALATAFTKKTVSVAPTPYGLDVDWTSPSLLNWKRTAPSPTGQKLLCPLIAEGNQLGLGQVTIRAFTPPDLALDVRQAHTAALELSIAIADQVTRWCATSSAFVSVASSTANTTTPLLRLELRPNAAETRVGL